MIERAEGIGKGKYVHMRCIAHIINLIVWDGIKDDQTSINRIKTAVKYIRNSPARFQRLKDLAERLNIDTKALLSQDCPTRWNSTYSMLNAACRLRRAIDGIDLPPSDKPDEHVPTHDDWAKVEQLVVFLRGFYITTKRISGALYLTSSKGLTEISGALSMLNKWKQNRDEKMQSMAVVMGKKYDKYWGDFDKMNLMVYMAVILDPHSKFVIVELTLEDMFGVEKAKQLARDVKKFAYELFEEYRSIYSPLASQSGQSCDVASSSIQVGEGEEFNYTKNVHERAKRMRGTAVIVSELERYMCEQLGVEEDDLDALDWWRLNGHRYPIISRMARDILAIPLSIVASESAFSAGGRTVDEFRSSLNPLTVQALICTQDWIRARNRKTLRAMEDNLKDLEEFEKIEEEMRSVTLDEEDNVIYIVEP